MAGPASAVMHAIILAALILHLGVAPNEQPTAAVEVELVRQSETQKGQPPSAPAATPQPESEPAPQVDKAPPPSPPTSDAPPPEPLSPAPQAAAPAAPTGTLPPPAPAAAAATPQPTPTPANPYANVPMPSAQMRAAPTASAEPAVHLGDSDEDREALSVTGDNVVSEGPDARYHNMPPHYPRDAARAHQHGAVSLLIHIAPSGQAGEIEVVDSSGIPSMDDAARIAVSRWRFKPPIRDGLPVRSVYLMQFNFVDDRQ